MDELNAKKIHGIERLKYIMERLRNPENGCPWDIEQTYESIAPYTIEEAYEVADAIDHKDMAALKDELGDLLFTCVNLARKLDIDPETALRHGNAKFERRFKAIEVMLAAEGKTPETSNLEEMDALWDRAKVENEV